MYFWLRPGPSLPIAFCLQSYVKTQLLSPRPGSKQPLQKSTSIFELLHNICSLTWMFQVLLECLEWHLRSGSRSRPHIRKEGRVWEEPHSPSSMWLKSNPTHMNWKGETMKKKIYITVCFIKTHIVITVKQLTQCHRLPVHQDIMSELIS